jgi:hypothetical protein
VVHCKPVASVDQSDLEFSIPEDDEKYIYPDIELYVKGKIVRRRSERISTRPISPSGRIIFWIPYSLNAASVSRA